VLLLSFWLRPASQVTVPSGSKSPEPGASQYFKQEGERCRTAGCQRGAFVKGRLGSRAPFPLRLLPPERCKR
jgi:hypothetical protein